MPLDLNGNIITSTSVSSGYFKNSIITNGLVLHIDSANKNSYVGSGTTLYDLSSTGNNGTIQSGVSYSNSNTGVLSFDTSANAYIQFPNNSSLYFGTGDFTLEMWIYPTSFSSYTHMFAMPDQNTFGLKANVSDGVIYFYSGGGFGTYGLTSGWTLSLNVWNHVVMVRRSGVAYCYLNAQLKGIPSGFTNNISGNAMNIGNGWGGEKTTKQISQARIYNRGLINAEVVNNYFATKARFGL